MGLIAWTQIRSGKDGKRIVVQAGEEVSASKLGLSSEQFDELILAGAVRDKDFPLPDNYPYSIRTYYNQQIQAAEGNQEKALELILSMKQDLASKPPPMALPDGVEPGGDVPDDATATGTEPAGDGTQEPTATTETPPATTEAPKT